MLDTAATLVALRDASTLPVQAVGAKASRLAVLVGHGFPVPEGFILGTSVHADAVRRSASGSPRFPEDLRVSFVQRCDSLGYPLVVRSSAVVEDGTEASFAGQYTSVLDVGSADEAVAAVERCWRAAAEEPVLSYRLAHGVADDALAVLIQRQLAPDAAGVAFGRDPVTGLDEVVIEAVAGLADRLLDGEVTPERWRVGDDGATRDPGQAPDNVLSEDQARSVAAVVTRLGEVFDRPQDVEWVVAGPTVYVVQSRPITTRTQLRGTPPDVPAGWIRDSTHWPERISPLGAGAWGAVIPASLRTAGDTFGLLIGDAAMHIVDHRAYLELLPFGGARRMPPPPPWLLRALVVIVPSIRRRIAHSVEAVETDVAGQRLEQWIAHDRDRLQAQLAERREQDLNELDATALAGRLDEAIAFLGNCLIGHYTLQFALAQVVTRYVRLARDLRGWDPATALAALELRSPSSAEGSAELDRIAALVVEERAAAAAPLVSPAARSHVSLERGDGPAAAAFRSYLEQFGTRSLGTDPIEPNLDEVPRELEAAIEAVIARESAGVAASARLTPPQAQEAVAPAAEGSSDWREAVRRVERYYGVRDENRLLALQEPIGLIRRIALALGHRLTDAGLLGRADDVFMLTPDELRGAAAAHDDFRGTAADRRREYALAALLPDQMEIGEVPQPDLRALPASARFANESLLWYLGQITGTSGSAVDADAVVVGTPASAGRHRGPVRLVRSAADFGRVREGDVLVCPTTTPAWSPVIGLAGAIVADHGGFLAHPAVIAREYGIPAIVGTGNGSAVLRDGELVLVDAVTGTVTRR